MGAAAIPLAIGAAGAAYQAYAQHEAGQFNKQINETMAQDALARGGVEEGLIKARGTRAIAAGTANAAGSNIDVASGSVADVAGGNRAVSAFDAALARSNALREAYGYRVRGAIAESESDNATKSTLISGVGNFISGGYKSGVFPTFGRG